MELHFYYYDIHRMLWCSMRYLKLQVKSIHANPCTFDLLVLVFATERGSREQLSLELEAQPIPHQPSYRSHSAACGTPLCYCCCSMAAAEVIYTTCAAGDHSGHNKTQTVGLYIYRGRSHVCSTVQTMHKEQHLRGPDSMTNCCLQGFPCVHGLAFSGARR